MKTAKYDVCVIGSGAAGGVLASSLARQGARVMMVEGGPYRDPRKLNNHSWPYERVKPQVPPVMIDTAKEPWQLIGDTVDVSRARVLGGRTTHWNAVTLRFAADDFREWSAHGIEEDWPLSYQELASYYDQAERLMVVCGTKEGLEALPDGQFIRPLALRCSETILGRAGAKFGMRLIPIRKALATEAGHGRLPCHYCGHCMRGCCVSAIFNTAEHVIPRGRESGRLDIKTGWMAHELISNEEARVTAARIVEWGGGKEEQIAADVFAVCCGSIESARLLLNSKSPRFPNGLANSNDVAGRYLHGHVVAETAGYLKDLKGRPAQNQDGAIDHAYIPRFKPYRKRDHVGGYGYQLNLRSYMYPHHAAHLTGYGESFKRRVRELQPAYSTLVAFGKVMASAENRITLHPTQKDINGLPIPVVHFRWHANERAMVRDMQRTARDIYEAAGIELLINGETEPRGFASHEVGTVRMGKDPKTSVLNKFNQTHEVKNLFVVDGGCFTTFPEKNPTLTIVALSLRAAKNILALKQKKEI